MPRIKKHRKRGRKYRKSKELSITPNSRKRTNINESFDYGDCATPAANNINSKQGTPKNTQNLEIIDSDTLICNEQTIRNDPFATSCTPVNKRRSLNRQKRISLNGTWNVTNLNALFDSSNLVSPSSEVHLQEKEEIRRRALSSIPKLHSPGKEKPLLLNKSTQTEDKELREIVETPKVTHHKTLVKDFEIPEAFAPLKNVINEKSNLLSRVSSEVNINPYLKEKDILGMDLAVPKQKWSEQQSSIEELSLFSPQLKTSSTPMDHLRGRKLLNTFKETILKENLDSSLHNTPRSTNFAEQVLNNSVDKTPGECASTRRENVNINTPPLGQKVQNKERSIQLLGSGKRKQQNGTPVSKVLNRTSPKIRKLINHSRTLNRDLNHSLKQNISRRESLSISCELLRSPCRKVGVYERMINKIKRYSKASAKWSMKMMEACGQLGIQIRNSISSLCKTYTETAMLNCSQTPCRCGEYREEMARLNAELLTVKERLQLQESNEKTKQKAVQRIQDELDKVKQEFHLELASIKEQVKRGAPAGAVLVPPPPPMPVAPPPPPPPPPMPLVPLAPPKPFLSKRAKSTLGIQGNNKATESRPVITLDDILKVKLKKPTDRSMTPVSRVTSNAAGGASFDPETLLRQVKLRSSTRTSLLRTPKKCSSLTPGGSGGSSEASTSPHSSLCRLLSAESVWRVKRLKKTPSFSLDTVHRRGSVTSMLAMGNSRERVGN